MSSAPAIALAEAAARLKEEARTHKKLEGQHRRQARALMQEHARLARICAEHGITITTGTAQEA